MKALLLFLIRCYQYGISIYMKPHCRFSPSCSKYAYEAITRFGAGRGSWLALKRILKCHPFYRGAVYFDPVPSEIAQK